MSGYTSRPLLQCPCCDFFALRERGAREICPLCYWDDDGSDLGELDRSSPANHISLRQARRNFQRCGAADDSATNLVAPKSEWVRFRRERRSSS